MNGASPSAQEASEQWIDGRWLDHARARLGRRWDAPVEVHATLPSTNERALAWARDGATPWSVVMAREQTAGRGRRGRVWESRPGLGLWMSLIVSVDASAPGALPIVVGLVVARSLETCVSRQSGSRVGPPSTGHRESPRVALKWPNDLLVGGRKLGGVLCEAAGPERVVVGIGVNLMHEPDDFGAGLRDTATSLRMACGVELPPWELAIDVLAGLRSRDELDALGPGDLDELAERDALRGREVSRGGRVAGVGAGFDPDGALLVGRPDGSVVRVRTGEIESPGGR